MPVTKYLRLLLIFVIFAFCYHVLLLYKNGARYTLSRKGIYENFYFSVTTKNSDFSVASVTSSSAAPETVKAEKRILFWTPTPPNCRDCAPFSAFKYGNLIFKQHNCEYQNCFITPNYGNLTEIDPENYDALMFNGRPTIRMGLDELPKRRRGDQVYIFVQLEAAVRFPVCQRYFDDFFNWTVTYRLDSDIPWTYFAVKNADNITVGPNKDIKWDEDSNWKVSDELEGLISNKTELAAWFVSNCYHGDSQRLNFVKKLNEELQR